MLAYPDPDLSRAAVTLRPWRDSDLGCIEQASGRPEIMPGTTVPAAFTPAAGRAFIERQLTRFTSGEGVSLAIAEDDVAVGLITVRYTRHPGVLSLGYWLVPVARGRRIASKAAGLLTEWALEQPDIARVEALTFVGNLASQATLLGAGFKREGVLRKLFVEQGERVDGVLFARV